MHTLIVTYCFLGKYLIQLMPQLLIWRQIKLSSLETTWYGALVYYKDRNHMTFINDLCQFYFDNIETVWTTNDKINMSV